MIRRRWFVSRICSRFFRVDARGGAVGPGVAGLLGACGGDVAVVVVHVAWC